MANNENLTPFTSDQSREEAVKNGRKGGIASGEAKREKKEMRDFAKLVFDELVKDKKSGAELPTRYAMVKRLVQKVLKDGDVSAFRELTKVAGEMPKDEEQNAPVVVIVNTSEKGAKAMERLKEID
jgi:hypothetical protein